MRRDGNSALGIRWAFVALVLAITLAASPGLAQSPTGNLFGTVADSDGQPLPGVTVTLSGVGATKTQITDQQGQFRFVALDPGQYTLKAELEGFGGIEYPGVEVGLNRNTTVPLALTPAVEETITVTSESPLLDERKLQQGTTVSQVELEKIPTARDPWAILAQTPGVLVDRVNVGGSESGQQSVFRAQGVPSDENDFLMDGVQITDMRAIGVSSSYYDFDQFAEMQFTTGGTDVTKNSGGVSVNLVTKRGTNEFRGSGRFYNTKAEGYFGGAMKQSQPNVTAEDLGSYGALPELRQPVPARRRAGRHSGLPHLRGRADPRDRGPRLRGRRRGPARSTLAVGLVGPKRRAAERGVGHRGRHDPGEPVDQGQRQITQANSAVASWNNGDKAKFGRGASPVRPDETTWNQRGPTAVYRAEDTHVFNSNLFVTGTWSHLDSGFALAARSGTGPDAPESWQDFDGVWHDSYLSGTSANPADEYKADASYFFNTGDMSHELKVGGRFRSFEAASDFAWPGRNIFTDTNDSTTTTFLVARRGVATPATLEYQSLWVQDTLSFGRFTVNLGLRYDDQAGVNEASTVPGNPLVPDVLPAIDFPGIGEEFDWVTIHPRVGVTYALGENRDTLLRASFAQFAESLSVNNVNRTNPAGTAYAYFAFPHVNAPFDGDGSTVSNSGFPINDPRAVAFPAGFDPTNPTSLVDPDVNDPDFDPVDHERVRGQPRARSAARVRHRRHRHLPDGRRHRRAARLRP